VTARRSASTSRSQNAPKRTWWHPLLVRDHAWLGIHVEDAHSGEVRRQFNLDRGQAGVVGDRGDEGARPTRPTFRRVTYTEVHAGVGGLDDYVTIRRS